jgi:sirohydrochlorin cobaltochelatase
VEGAFLELATPTIEEGLAHLAERGARRAIVAPLLLFEAGHAKDDIPQAVAAAAQRLGIEIVGQSDALQSHPKLIELSRWRFQAALGSETQLAETVLLMVGRGGSDETANAAACEYARVLGTQLGVATEIAFVAIASPSLSASLVSLAEKPRRCVVVQPHLLFRGEVLSSIAKQVQAAVQAQPEIDWRMAAHLGPHELIVEALLSRIAEVAAT